MTHGILIGIEGIDGSGKTTLARALEQELAERRYDVVLTKEPGGTPLGMHIRNLLQEHQEQLDRKAEYLLFAADRAQHYTQTVIPALQDGMLVISDRTGDSSIAYQGFGRGLDLNIIMAINHWATQAVKPSMTFYVQVDYETACERIQERNETVSCFEKEHRAFFERVIRGFEQLYQGRKDVVVLDGLLSPEALAEQARDIIFSIIESQSNGSSKW